MGILDGHPQQASSTGILNGHPQRASSADILSGHPRVVVLVWVDVGSGGESFVVDTILFTVLCVDIFVLSAFIQASSLGILDGHPRQASSIGIQKSSIDYWRQWPKVVKKKTGLQCRRRKFDPTTCSVLNRGRLKLKTWLL